MTAEVVNFGVVAVIDLDVLTEIFGNTHISVASEGVESTACTGFHVFRVHSAQSVAHHFMQERSDVEAHALVERSVGHVVVIDQHAVDGMDVAVERLDVGLIDKDSFLHHRGDGWRSQFCLAVGQRAVGHPAVDARRTVDARELHQRVGQHRLHVLVDGSG